MQSIKFNFILMTAGCFICAIIALLISIYSKPFEFAILNASFLFLSVGIYILSIIKKDYGLHNKPLVKSKVVIYILLPILILFDFLLFYAYLFASQDMLKIWGVIDKTIVGQFALIILSWIGTIINFKHHKTNK